MNATGHTCESTVVEASCLGYGYTEHHCKDCDYSYISSMVQPLGHDYVATVVDPRMRAAIRSMFVAAAAKAIGMKKPLPLVINALRLRISLILGQKKEFAS